MEQLTIQTVYQNNLDLERFSFMLDALFKDLVDKAVNTVVIFAICGI